MTDWSAVLVGFVVGIVAGLSPSRRLSSTTLTQGSSPGWS
jgi:uncharacterized membrane-anchored protein YhcB (DUF1043 family)